MRTVIFGASGRTGRLLVEQALAAGHDVAAVTRRPESIAFRDRLVIIGADIADGRAVDSAIAGNDAVLSVVATPYSRKPIKMFSLGASNMVAAMRRHALRRLIVVSSAMVDPAWQPSGAFFFNRVVDPMILRKLGRTLYEDLERMEKVVRESELEWTIFRPSGLFDTGKLTDYQLVENSADGQYTARADLAASILQQLTDDRFVRKAVGVITTEINPNVAQLMSLWSEAFRREKRQVS